MAWRIINPDGSFEDERIAKWRRLTDTAMTTVINAPDPGVDPFVDAYIQDLDKRIVALEAEIQAAGLTLPGARA